VKTVRGIVPDEEEISMSERDDARREVPSEAVGSDRAGEAPDVSKDAFFERVAALSNEMVERHGTEFAMGTLVLAARFIAEGKPLAPNGDRG